VLSPEERLKRRLALLGAAIERALREGAATEEDRELLERVDALPRGLGKVQLLEITYKLLGPRRGGRRGEEELESLTAYCTIIDGQPRLESLRIDTQSLSFRVSECLRKGGAGCLQRFLPVADRLAEAATAMLRFFGLPLEVERAAIAQLWDNYGYRSTAIALSVRGPGGQVTSDDIHIKAALGAPLVAASSRLLPVPKEVQWMLYFLNVLREKVKHYIDEETRGGGTATLTGTIELGPIRVEVTEVQSGTGVPQLVLVPVLRLDIYDGYEHVCVSADGSLRYMPDDVILRILEHACRSATALAVSAAKVAARGEDARLHAFSYLVHEAIRAVKSR